MALVRSSRVCESSASDYYTSTTMISNGCNSHKIGGHFTYRCRVERSLLWEVTGSLVPAGYDLRVGNQLLISKPNIRIKQTVFNRAHTKDPRPTSSIQR